MVLSSIFVKGGSMQKGGATDILSLVVKNRNFLLKIFSNLFVQLGISYYTMENTPLIKSVWPTVIGSFVALLLIIATNLPYGVKLLIFCVFSYLIGRMNTIYKTKYGDDAISNAILGAMGVFAIMFVVGALLPVLGYKVGIALFIALLCLLVARIFTMFSEKTEEYKKWLSTFGIGIFGLYIAYDTNNILKRADYYQGDFVTASMDYYLDIINLFGNMLHLNN
jgi:FtsH-binding integral membrane protein